MKKTVSFSKNSINVFFHILTKCNLKCKHCYINPKQHGKNSVPIETINAWLTAFYDKRKKANVIFLGGEPTLHKDLPVAIKKAKEMGYSSVTVDTNGYLFNDILSKITNEDLDFLSFSLDGATKEINDKIRGDGSYERCISGITKAVSLGFKTSLIYTVSSKNINELHLMIPLLKKIKIDRFFIQIIGIRGKSVDNNNSCKLQISIEKWQSIVPNVANKIAESGIVVTYPKVFLKPDEVFECAGNVAENYFVFPNGRVYRCPLCEDFPIHGQAFDQNSLVKTKKLNEIDFFKLKISEGCVMNRLIQPDNISYDDYGKPKYKVACCMLKEEIIK
jgi:MoaA/NifB/PqqE/SkfB family radical SAM enzyme